MFFDQLQKVCKEKGTSPSAVANKIGKSKSAVTRWKKGQEPSLGDALRAASVLNCDVTDLIGPENIKEKLVSYYDGFLDGASTMIDADNAEKQDGERSKEKPATDNDDGFDEKKKEWLSLYEKIPENRRAEYAAMLEAALKSQGLI